MNDKPLALPVARQPEYPVVVVGNAVFRSDAVVDEDRLHLRELRAAGTDICRACVIPDLAGPFPKQPYLALRHDQRHQQVAVALLVGEIERVKCQRQRAGPVELRRVGLVEDEEGVNVIDAIRATEHTLGVANGSERVAGSVTCQPLAVPSTITRSSPLSAIDTGVRSPGVMAPSSVPVQVETLIA